MTTPAPKRRKPKGPKRPPKTPPDRRPAPPEAAGFAPRRAASTLLQAVLDGGQTLDQAEKTARAAFDGLEPRDRGLARMTALTALRRLGQIDAAIEARLETPLPDEAAPARAALRIGVAEILFLDTPAYAAVDAAVRLAKRGAPRFAGLVNAVLRRIAAEPPVLAPEAAARLDTPGWLWDLLVADWGEDAAAAIAAAQLTAPPLDLTAKSLDPEEQAALLGRLGGARTPTGAIRLTEAGPVTALPGYDAGLWWVQDAAAALPARLLDPKPGLSVLDLCAAPGGKTLQLAAAGAAVTALDISASRLRRVAENLARLGLEASLVAAKAEDWTPERAGGFDAVLLDAPCSASGTFRRHPDGLRLKTAEGLPTLAQTQDRLLDAAWTALKPGGRLVYCVCSLFKSEGEDRASAFLTRHADAAPAPIGPEEARALGDPALVSAAGWLRTLPSHWSELGGLDGFFAARFEKAAR